MWAEYNRIAIEQEQPEQWEKTALERGWPLHFEGVETHADGSLRLHTVWDIRTQFLMAILCLLVAVPVALRVVLARSRTMTADDAGFVSIDGTRIPYSAIRDIDRSKWQRKSIAVITYELNGAVRRTKIDDWIFEGGEAVLLQIEERTGLGKGTDESAPPPSAGGTDDGEGLAGERT
jgi:hypothetical protein